MATDVSDDAWIGDMVFGDREGPRDVGYGVPSMVDASFRLGRSENMALKVLNYVLTQVLVFPHEDFFYTPSDQVR